MKLLLVCVVAAAVAAPGFASGLAPAVTILKNARVVVEAGAAAVPLEIAVEGEKIAFVGPPGEAARRFPGAAEIDLSGGVVYPGLVDAHGHLAELGMSLESVDLKGVSSAKACAERMGAHPAPAGVWVAGQGWDQNLWTPRQFPDASDLDAVLPGSARVREPDRRPRGVGQQRRDEGRGRDARHRRTQRAAGSCAAPTDRLRESSSTTRCRS